MKIAQYVETFGYVGMFNTMNFASYICLYLISPFMQHPVLPVVCGTVNTLQFPGAALGGATPPQQRAESGWRNVFIILFKIFYEMQNFCATQIFCLNLDYKD